MLNSNWNVFVFELYFNKCILFAFVFVVMSKQIFIFVFVFDSFIWPHVLVIAFI